MSKIKQYLPISTRQLFYNNYLVPVIDYGSTIWGTTAKTQIERIFRLQKRAARIILDKPPDLTIYNADTQLSICLIVCMFDS